MKVKVAIDESKVFNKFSIYKSMKPKNESSKQNPATMNPNMANVQDVGMNAGNGGSVSMGSMEGNIDTSGCMWFVFSLVMVYMIQHVATLL